MTLKTKSFSSPKLIFPVVVIMLTLWIFAKPFFSGETLWSLDNAPIYPHNFQEMNREAMTGYWHPSTLGTAEAAKPLHHSRIMAMVLPPFMYRVMSFVVNVLLTIGAGYYFLRGRGVRGLAAWLPAIGLGYSGYMFTIISAGHITLFDMYPYAIFAFGLMDRAITRRSLWHYAAAGFCIGMGIGTQPDVLFLFAVLLSAFSLYVLISNRPEDKKAAGKYFIHFALGGIIASIFFIGIALTLFGNLKNVYIPQRNAMRGDTEDSKWEYSTNWSMPPEDALEFFVPNLFGRETTDREAPYWGRLGQSLNWTPENRQGFFNYRQHNVYLGALPLLFGMYAITKIFRRRPDDDPDDPTRRDTLFWGGAFVLTTLLAMGRYTPLYKLFWLIPAAERIRCPVKFVHLTELAVLGLFSAGLVLFLRDLKRVNEADDTKKASKPLFIFSMTSLGLAVVLLVTGPMVAGSSSLAIYWQKIGMGAGAKLFQQNLSGATSHAALLCFAVALAFFLASKFAKTNWCRPAVCTLIAGTILLDLGVTNRPFVRVKDISNMYKPNHIAEFLAESAPPHRTAYFLSPRAKTDPLYINFIIHGTQILDLRQSTTPAPDELAFFQAFSKDPVRLWTITGTRYIVGHLQQFQQMLANPAFRVKEYFNASGDGRVFKSDKTNGKQVLVEYSNALPRAMVYHAYDVLEPDDALANMSRSPWNARQRAFVSGEISPRQSQAPASPATITHYSAKRIELDVNASEEGLLVLSDRYHPAWKVTVNDEPSPLLQANYIMRGIPVPAGKSTVVLTYYPYKMQANISILVTLILLGWGIYNYLQSRKNTALLEKTES